MVRVKNSTKTKRILVVDGNPLLYRADSVLDLTDHTGTRVSGVYGTIKLLHLVIQQMQPTEVYVCWDSPSSSLWRRYISPAYKAHRKPKDEADKIRKYELYHQIDLTKEILHHFPIHQLRHVGLEADDLAYWICERSRIASDCSIIAVTIDKDWLQLVSPRTGVLLSHTNVLWTMDNFNRLAREDKKLSGIKRENFLLFKALQGDKGDGVAGIRGVGPKTAAKLANEYRGRLNLLAERKALKPEDIWTCREGLLLMDLSLFPYTSDLDKALHKMEEPNVDWVTVKELFQHYGFASFLAEFRLFKQTFEELHYA